MRQPTEHMESTIEDALQFIPPHDRELWYKMGMAIHSELGPHGFCIWDNWSQQDTRPAPHGYNPRDAKSVWNSFHQRGGITMGSLWSTAAEWGWEPRSANAVRVIAQVPEAAPPVIDEARLQREREAAALATRIFISALSLIHI